MTRRRVGILELLVSSTSRGPLDRAARRWFVRQSASVMPQVIAAWARRAGHRVHYATWWGQAAPESLLPSDLDVVLLACHSRASLWAYALAEIWRRRGVHSVIGGPHATSFPHDAARVFDTVVLECDEPLLRDLLDDPTAHRGIVSARGLPAELPSLEERVPELRASAMYRGRVRWPTTIPLLASLGCPYDCDFCTDAARPWRALSRERLTADLEFAERTWPGVRLVFHDPNFAVRFDETLEVLSARPARQQLPYAMQATLSVITPRRLERLEQTRCVYVAPSLETFSDYSRKAGVGRRHGRDKLDRVADHLEQVARSVPGVQVNVIFGLDQDGDGREHIELTLALIRRLPRVLVTATVAMPYGGTELHRRLRQEGRLLEALPPAFYYLPDIAHVRPDGDSPEQLYERLIAVFREMTSTRLLTRRLTTHLPWQLKVLHDARALEARRMLRRLVDTRRRLDRDRELARFLRGECGTLPAFYRERARRALGRYRELLSEDWLVPRHEAPRPLEPAYAQQAPD